jgi:predicted NBD/HSP70 family sugar kinase
MIERGPVWIGHKHRGEAAVRYFAGLDVSLEETAICIIDETGSIVREARVVSEPDALVSFFDLIERLKTGRKGPPSPNPDQQTPYLSIM